MAQTAQLTINSELNITPYRAKRRRTVESFCTISDRGSIFLSSGFVKNERIGSFQQCRLGYDKYNKIITINFTTLPPSEDMLPVKIKEGSFSMQIKSFFNAFALPLESVSGKYKVYTYKVYPNGDKTFGIALKGNDISKQ